MVTNGTLIDRFAPVLREFLDVIHVSVDGMEEAHDRVRGRGCSPGCAAISSCCATGVEN
ncbi:MAG: hypothetical protein L6W00_23815 [Lentisphaeria bacterium]|nr:MAG: hypothetical protein L6W00_23815 [Lentisphaeria bacterium]